MSQISREPPSTPLTATDIVPPEGGAYPAPSPTWQGWAYFGAVIMGLLGLLQALVGLIALVDQEYFTLRENSLLVASSYAAWGWAHLIVGLAAVAAGAGIVLGGHRWARTTGIVVAGLSAVVNLGYLAASPVWAVLMIALDLVIIFALTVHGREIDTR